MGEIAKESNVLTPNVFDFALFSDDDDNTKSTLHFHTSVVACHDLPSRNPLMCVCSTPGANMLKFGDAGDDSDGALPFTDPAPELNKKKSKRKPLLDNSEAGFAAKVKAKKKGKAILVNHDGNDINVQYVTLPKRCFPCHNITSRIRH